MQNGTAMTMSDGPASPGAPPLKPDERIGNYRLVRQLANGGMGAVYEAVHTILPRRAALKVMHRELLAVDGSARRLLQEASILETFHHPGVVRVHDCGTLPDGRPWLAMELVHGVTLSSRLARLGPMTVAQVLTLLDAIAEVLVVAHARGIVHRDLKPDNILVDGGGTVPLRVIDWGIACQDLPGPRLTFGDTTLGTPSYMAPEQARGLRVDGRCDIYALGVLAFEALIGEVPFVGTSAVDVMTQHLTTPPPPLQRLRPDVPAFLAALVAQMLAKEPDDRPTARQLRELLAAFEAAEPYEELVISADGPAVPCDELGPIVAAPSLADDDDNAYLELTVLDEPVAPAGARDATPERLRLRTPRWTPPGPVTPHPHVRRAVTPRSSSDAVAGEVDHDS